VLPSDAFMNVALQVVESWHALVSGQYS